MCIHTHPDIYTQREKPTPTHAVVNIQTASSNCLTCRGFYTKLGIMKLNIIYQRPSSRHSVINTLLEFPATLILAHEWCMSSFTYTRPVREPNRGLKTHLNTLQEEEAYNRFHGYKSDTWSREVIVAGPQGRAALICLGVTLSGCLAKHGGGKMLLLQM